MTKLVILVGLPGSGKSFLAKKFIGYAILNQDAIIGGREVLLKKTQMQLGKGKNVVIDRCNITPEQREPFITVAKQLGVRVEARVLVISPRICKNRISRRDDHPTVTPEMTWVVNKFMNMNNKAGSSYPQMDEGIDYIRKLYWCINHNTYHKYVCKRN